eukprot:CAMPEP_0182533036 /NCGR_PEP_ID=MMETSP1323-20130603/12939_1 /TAXON_ID=236787 /ORGANISM="Florenciella parvula, Strain RCC1693" /LENGTH=63 /DNA_ID=CAMNT_0024742865 /DNA_START=108 /DNA_END=296 /DNA_ORIENTATION=+
MCSLGMYCVILFTGRATAFFFRPHSPKVSCASTTISSTILTKRMVQVDRPAGARPQAWCQWTA